MMKSTLYAGVCHAGTELPLEIVVARGFDDAVRPVRVHLHAVPARQVLHHASLSDWLSVPTRGDQI